MPWGRACKDGRWRHGGGGLGSPPGEALQCTPPSSLNSPPSTQNGEHHLQEACPDPWGAQNVPAQKEPGLSKVFLEE